jgi:hypothetical protein
VAGCSLPLWGSKNVLNVVRKVTVYDLENTGRFSSPPQPHLNRILLDLGESSLNPIELGWIGCVDIVIRMDKFLFNLWWKFPGHNHIYRSRTRPLVENLEINLPVRESSRKHGCDTKLVYFL